LFARCAGDIKIATTLLLFAGLVAHCAACFASRLAAGLALAATATCGVLQAALGNGLYMLHFISSNTSFWLLYLIGAMLARAGGGHRLHKLPRHPGRPPAALQSPALGQQFQLSRYLNAKLRGQRPHNGQILLFVGPGESYGKPKTV
jgi:hypothetical protein